MEHKIDTQKIIYQLSIEDIFTVSNELLNRDLTEKEIHQIEKKLGDYIDWYSAIEYAIEETLEKSQ